MIRLTQITLVLWVVWLGSALAQDLDTPRADKRLADIERSIADLRETFEKNEQQDLLPLRETLNGLREDLTPLLDQIEQEQQQLAPQSVEGGEAQTDDADESSEASDTASVEALSAVAELSGRAETVKRDLDLLTADIAARQRLTELQIGVDERRAEIERAQQNLSVTDPPADLLQIREMLRALKLAGEAATAPLRESREELRADLDRLGPPPAEDGPPELAEITQERGSLTLALLKEDAIIRQSDINAAEINRLLDDIAELRRDQFYEQIFSRGPSPLRPDIAQTGAQNFLSGVHRLASAANAWRDGHSQNGGLWQAYGIILCSLVIGLFFFMPARRWSNTRVLSKLQQLEPTPGRRAGAALVQILSRAVPGAIAGAVVFEALRSQGIVNPESAALARTIWFGFLALLATDAGATAAMSPGSPGWRLLPLHKVSGQIVRACLLALVFLFFADRAFSAGAVVFGGAQELALLQSAAVAIAMALVMLFVARQSVWRLAEGREDVFSTETKNLWRTVRRGIQLIAVLIILAALSAYVALAYYTATRVFMLGALVALGLFVRLIAQEAIDAVDRSFAGNGAESDETETEQEKFIFFWIGAFIDFTIILVLTPIAFLALGAEWTDVRDTVRDAFFGFKIGGVTISIAEIFGAISLFVVILGITRFIQRTGEKRFFPRTRLDIGVQNSLKTIIGYVGLVIAFMTAVSALGFDLSNLAIIAGALSVGIGFGLQSIVNNFVSGLILLFERPIKVGDWIVTSSGEGIVKQISVRSTEIETFDRSSVIVPNSELISEAVTNWTHKDKIGRIIVPVGVSYDSDPNEVIRLLEEVAKEQPFILEYPAPFIFFAGFGDSSLDFELRGYIRDINSSLSSRTKIRVAIFNKFREANLEIPFPQRDVNIRNPLSFDSSFETSNTVPTEN